MEKQGKNILWKFGWGLVGLSCVLHYISSSTNQDYINAPSRQNVENPSPNATFQEDIKSTDTLDWFTAASLVSGAACLFLSTKKQKTK